MNATLKKLIVVLCLVILLPVTIYSIYEISTLTENEQELKTIYERQLEAVLFSVNLHSQDLVNSTVSKLENSGILQQTTTDKKMTADVLEKASFFIESTFLEAIHFAPFEFDTAQQQLFIAEDQFFYVEDWLEVARNLRQEHQKIVAQLVKYQKQGFRKIQPLTEIKIKQENFNTLAFVRQINQQPYICILFLNPAAFSQQVLIPKLQMLGQQEFELSISVGKDSVIYNTSDTLRSATVTKEMWLLPSHKLGISPIGTTLAELTQDRNQLNILSLGLLIVFILLGILLFVHWYNTRNML